MYAMQAIETKFLCPTNHRGSRVSAKCAAGRVIVDWDHAMNPADNHAAAVLILASRLGWADRRWHLGCKADGGYVAVCVGTGNAITCGGYVLSDRDGANPDGRGYATT